MTGGTAKRISTSPGSDSTPLYSPDGKYIAWRSQARAGFESDKWRLFVQDRQSGKIGDLTEKFDRSVGSFTWWDTMAIIFSCEDHGQSPINFVVQDVVDASRSRVLPATQKGIEMHANDLIWLNGILFFTRDSAHAPGEIWTDKNMPAPPGLYSGSDFHPVTHMNEALLSQIDMQPLEVFTFKGANDEEVQGFMVKPPRFDPAKKYPLKFLIHGGPQGAWGNSWTYRWNAELFAAPSSPQSVGRDFVEPNPEHRLAARRSLALPKQARLSRMVPRTATSSS